MWTDRQGCGEIVISMFFCKRGTFIQTKFITGITPYPAFRLFFHSFCHFKKPFALMLFQIWFHPILLIYFMDKAFQFVPAFPVFFITCDIRIIKISSNIKIIGQDFQTMTGTRGTAAMKQKLLFTAGIRYFLQFFFHHSIIVCIFHYLSLLFYKK